MTTKYVVLASGATWTVPSDYGTLVSIEALGGGQAGQSVSSGSTGAGGKGGYYCKITSATNIIAGDVLTIAIGAAGSASLGNGGDTYLEDNTSTKILVAPGGNSGTTAVGNTKYAGGTGGAAGGAKAGGGGSSGGPSGAGNNGAQNGAGASPGYLADGVTPCGAGGIGGGSVNTNGSPGNQYGGAGGGGFRYASTQTGGAGYAGVIVIAYSTKIPSTGFNMPMMGI